MFMVDTEFCWILKEKITKYFALVSLIVGLNVGFTIKHTINACWHLVTNELTFLTLNCGDNILI